MLLRKFFTISCLLCSLSTFSCASSPEAAKKTPSVSVKTTPSFKAFTGKISKNKVRLRSQPHLDGQIIREAGKDEMFVVLGEVNDFYAVQPPKDTKAYVYRTFVLDNVVEGSRVNVRLQPDLESPIIAQLNSGDRVEGGAVSAQNNKWLEITPPTSSRFYVAKEFVQNAGAADLMDKLEQRYAEASEVLGAIHQRVLEEVQKPYSEMQVDAIVEYLMRLVNEYADLAVQHAQANDLLKMLQDTYMQKKLAFIESQAKESSETLAAANSQLKQELEEQHGKLRELELQIMQNAETAKPVKTSIAEGGGSCLQSRNPSSITAKMSDWNEIEDFLFREWSVGMEHLTKNDFYSIQAPSATRVKGVVEVFPRPSKNKPGDYQLTNRSTNLPVAYLYSTQVNLQDFVGHEVTIVGLERDNHHFAYPAYHVISVE